MRQALIFLSLVLCHATADAYIGPGLGAGALGVILGVIASILLALVAIVWYPLKRLIKKVRGPKKPDKKDGEQADETGQTP